MADNFGSYQPGIDAPAGNGFAVTPHATNPLPTVSRALFVGTGGSLVVRLVNDSADVTFASVADGTLLPIRASHVRATSTASNIVALY